MLNYQRVSSQQSPIASTQATWQGPRNPRGRAAPRRPGARRGCRARGALRGALGGSADVESQGWHLGGMVGKSWEKWWGNGMETGIYMDLPY